MELEYIANMKICDTIGINLISDKSEVYLLWVQVDICGDCCVCITINSFAQRESNNEIGTDDLLGSLRYDNWEYSWLWIRNRLEVLILFTASDILVDEGVYE